MPCGEDFWNIVLLCVTFPKDICSCMSLFIAAFFFLITDRYRHSDWIFVRHSDWIFVELNLYWILDITFLIDATWGVAFKFHILKRISLIPNRSVANLQILINLWDFLRWIYVHNFMIWLVFGFNMYLIGTVCHVKMLFLLYWILTCSKL